MKARAACAALLLTLATPAFAQTIGEIQTKAAAGDRDSQFLLGEAYRTGQGVTPDRDQAIAWFRKAASLGDLRAADALGLLLFTKGDRKESIPLLEAAETRQDARALYLLATARFNGDGVPKDLPRSYAEMRASADRGLPQAIRSLQLMEPYVTDQDRAASAAIRPGQPVPPTPPAAAPAAQPGVPATTAALPPRAAPTPIQTIELPPSQPSSAAPLLPPRPEPQPAPATSPASLAPPPPVAPPPAAPAAKPPVAKSPVETAPLRPAPAPPPASGKWRVQLGAIATQEKAEEHWRLLVKKLPRLASLPHVTAQAGAIWRLQASGLSSRADAQDLCKAVIAKGGDCIALNPAP
ncbi:SPOR domain-containing protein [Sphingomonas sp.]|uniref:SPOR domain-containing protein n=1 Tax=Sphingomonas sp. TaxID=28214 RepID=UPI000DB7A4A2|nr:SPOR domain-containing protein [Sphingomonas sp.]PZU09159.1 MAG: hypothetical protein DI605_10330 [Sphingomonas sp.]